MEKDALFCNETLTPQFYNVIKGFLWPKIQPTTTEQFHRDISPSPNDTCNQELLSNIIDDEYSKYTNGFHQASTKSRIYDLTNLGIELQRVITGRCMQRQSNILEASKSFSSLDRLLHIKKQTIDCLQERLIAYKQWSLHHSIGIAKTWQKTKQLEYFLPLYNRLAKIHDYRNVLRIPHLSYRARIVLCICIIDEIRILEAMHDWGNLVIFQNLEKAYRSRMSLLIRSGLRQLDSTPNILQAISFFKVLGLGEDEICRRGLDLLKKDLSSTTLCTLKRYCSIDSNTSNDRRLEGTKVPMDIDTCSSLLGPNVIILALSKLLSDILAFFTRCSAYLNGEKVLECLDGIPAEFRSIVSTSLDVDLESARVKICRCFPQIQTHAFKLIAKLIEHTNLGGIKDNLDLIKMACLLRFFICFNKVGIRIEEGSTLIDHPKADAVLCEAVSVVRAPAGIDAARNTNLASLDTVCSISTETDALVNSPPQYTKNKTAYSTNIYPDKQTKASVELSTDDNVCVGDLSSPCRVHYEIYKEAALILDPLKNSSADLATETNRLEDMIRVMLLDRYLDTIELACISQFDSLDQVPTHRSHYYRQRVNFWELENMFEQKITEGKRHNGDLWISDVNPFMGWTPNSPFLSLRLDSKLNIVFEPPFNALDVSVAEDIVANFGAVATEGSLAIWSHFSDFVCAATLQPSNARQYIDRFVSLLDMYVDKLLTLPRSGHLQCQPSFNALRLLEVSTPHFWRHFIIIESCRCLLELVCRRVDMENTELSLCLKTFCTQKLKVVAEWSKACSEALGTLLNSKIQMSTSGGSNMPYIDAGFRALKQQLGNIQEHMRKLPEPVKAAIWGGIYEWAMHKQKEDVAKAFEGAPKGYTAELLRANFSQVIERISSIRHYHHNRMAAYKRKYWNNIKEMGVYQDCY